LGTCNPIFIGHLPFDISLHSAAYLLNFLCLF
jgi:hypothetical protein